ncbi:glycosyl transferase family 2 [Bifidobacterium sp. DSM 109957]|uniref:Glycosyl transferase family 2 n=2 Tax=Bifidobacterium oedipodis TaxID=2675322 RepID=A0A7Y0ERR3_9BIFI|nr:glycosyl transferase family 2 [Bifidobacterium sp. DSM 109957]
MDVRIIAHCQKNQGASKTRERGVQYSKGRYVCFVDADDHIEKDYLEKMVKCMIVNNAQIVCCNAIEKNIISGKIVEQQTIFSTKEILSDFFAYKQYTCVVWASLYDVNLFNNVLFPEIRYGEDTSLKMQVLIGSQKTVLMPYEGYHYCSDNPDSAMHAKKDVELAYGSWFAHNLVYQYCKKNNMMMREATKDICNSSYGILSSIVQDVNLFHLQRWKKIFVQTSMFAKQNHVLNIKIVLVYIYTVYPLLCYCLVKTYKSIKELRLNI